MGGSGVLTFPLTYVFVVLTFIFSYPISLILDHLLGDGGAARAAPVTPLEV